MRYTTIRLALALAALILVAAPGTSAPPHTGIQGNFILFRVPVMWPTPIFAQPVATSFTVVSAVSGREVDHVATDTNGTFRVSLPPGRYVLMADPLPNALGCGDAAPVEVTVRAREFTTVSIIYICQWQIIVGIP